MALPPASLTAPVAHEVRYQYNVFFDGHYTYPLGITRLLLTPAGIKTEFAPDLPAGLGQTLAQAGEAAFSGGANVIFRPFPPGSSRKARPNTRLSLPDRAFRPKTGCLPNQRPEFS